MHILLIHQAFAALNEAGGTRHIEMARYLVERGHRITIITSPISYITGKSEKKKIKFVETSSPEPGITILRSYAYPALHRSFIHRVFNFISFMFSSLIVGLKVKDVDLVWGTTPPIFQSGTAWLIARLKRKPILLEIRDLWPKFAIAMGVLHNPVLISTSRWFERFLYRHADKVMVNSPGYIDHVTERGAKHVAMIPNGADPAMFPENVDGAAFREKHQLQDKFVVLYAGAHGMANDLIMTLEAANQLRHRTDICILLIGDGKEKEKLRQQAEEMNLSNVLFLPAASKNEMPEIMAASDAGLAILMPIDAFKSTYPNKVFDYMAAGRPVVLVIDGVIREVVEKAHAGIFSPPGNPQTLAETIEYMADHQDLVSEMGRSGRDYIKKHFNRVDLTEKMVTLLEGMSNKP
jgi:glycosyltransferase involved in cell wall biosynthesis